MIKTHSSALDRKYLQTGRRTYGNRMRTFKQYLFLFLIASASTLSSAGEWSGFAGLEFRGFNQTAQDTRQDHDTNFSFVFEPEYFHEWDDGDQSIAFVPYVRVDENDNERTHFDIRELTY